MENILQDIRYSFRTLSKNPGFAAVAVLTLAMGIGANTAMFSVVENVLLRPLPYPQPENLVQIWNTYQPQVPRAALSPGDYADWGEQNASFSEMGAYVQLTRGFNLTGEGEAQRVLGSYASARRIEETERTGNHQVSGFAQVLWRARGADGGSIRREVTEHPAGSFRGGGAGAADCLREHREPAAGAQFGKRAGSRGANGVGSEPVAVVAAVADGKFAAGGGGRGGWVAAGGWGAGGADGGCSRGPGTGREQRG